MNTDNTFVDAIAARLRQTEPAIADGGFTAAVITRLPHSRELPAWQKNTLLLAATALGSAIVAWQVPLPVIPDLLDVAVANWPTLLSAGAILTYSAAAVALWVAHKY